MAPRMTLRQRELERLLRFEPCPTCAYDLATGEGERACHYYACPYLPEELNVGCPRCNHNFLTDDIRPECGEPPSCEFARREAPRRVENLRIWLEHHRARRPQPL